jgi:integrase
LPESKCVPVIRRRIFERYLYPKLGERQIDSIKRSEITRLLDHIEDDNGPVMADHVLAMLRKLMNWHASRGDDFRSPIVRGMAKTKPKDRARKRVLSDDELRAGWGTAVKFPGPFGYLVRFILLTATRINEAARMTRDELSSDGTDWVIPGSRHKSKLDFVLPVSRAAQDLLEEIPKIGRKGWVFTTDGETPISGFSKWKARFDAEMAAELRKQNPKAELQHWVVHDLRRTARSLMSRAGVSPDHAERALGHLIRGVRGTYDRYEFKAEKARAFEALALQIAHILDPQEKIVALRGVR